jgi:hypothetical protein
MAATLASAVVGYQAMNGSGDRLLDRGFINAVVMLVIFTCVVGPILTERFAQGLPEGKHPQTLLTRMARKSVVGRRLLPGVALDREVVTDREQGTHELRVEWLLVGGVEAGGDVRKVEIQVVAFRGKINAVQITHPLGLNE